jgi:protein TonB
VEGPQDIEIRKRLKPPELPWTGPYFRECDPGVVSPVLISEVKPSYTRAAMTSLIQGIVGIEGIVGTDGVIREMRIRRSLDAELGLDAEAVRTVRQWRFAPGTKLGQPVPVLVEIEISFRLK